MKDKKRTELMAEVRAVQLHQGLYLLTHPDQPDDWMVPVVSLNGKIFAIKIDQELTPGGFKVGTRFQGPYWPEKRMDGK